MRIANALRIATWSLGALAVVGLGALTAGIASGLQGYRPLAFDDFAASLRVQPIGPQRFAVTLRLLDGTETRYEMAGDQVRIDAHILKWNPIAGLLGLGAVYKLDRIGGRYRIAEEERASARTVHLLGEAGQFDLFSARRRYAFLAPFLDAEHDSAVFIAMAGPAELELHVSDSGLRLREAGAQWTESRSR